MLTFIIFIVSVILFLFMMFFMFILSIGSMFLFFRRISFILAMIIIHKKHKKWPSIKEFFNYELGLNTSVGYTIKGDSYLINVDEIPPIIYLNNSKI